MRSQMTCINLNRWRAKTVCSIIYSQGAELLSYSIFVVLLQSDDLKRRKEPHIAGIR